MAYTKLTTQVVAATGIVPTFTAASAAGNSIDGTGDVFLGVVNGGGGSINVTVKTPATVDGLAVADQVVAVANGATKWIGPFPARTYTVPSGQTDEGLVQVDFSGVTSVTVGAFAVRNI